MSIMDTLDLKIEESARLYDEIMKARFEYEELMRKWDLLHEEIRELTK